MNNLLYITSTIVLMGSVLALAIFGIKLLSALGRHSHCLNKQGKVDEIMSQLDDTIKLSVIMINNSMVERLKQSNSFYQQDREEAFYEAKNRIMHMVNEQDVQYLHPYIDNIDEWINNRIEYYVRFLKKHK
ncbi:hypothetical protein Amet_1485 [Alkaliphilus metalliredigens QYMF]|uniref:Uncharacterized protein n=1 Tax=Alkaliphilus metalliredigens (strain QYMF) TaxID=293826 RepID=A6TNB3_ALKMQ|nr:hypothetical protein [Alkaliphilus metalliredigens]ABR47681.1 hypothetical protein Amet_1485 [Alkaliphilus metalliredigens QYMF]